MRRKGIIWGSIPILLTLIFPLISRGEIKVAGGFLKPGLITKAPDFYLGDMEGNQKGLADYKDKVLLVHFWATWCVPCREELPSLKELWEGYRDKGLVVIAIAEDSRKRVKPFAEEYQLDFPVLIDQYGGVMRDYGVRMLPTSYLVNKNGEIEGIAIGPRKWDSQETLNLIQGLLTD